MKDFKTVKIKRSTSRNLWYQQWAKRIAESPMSLMLVIVQLKQVIYTNGQWL